MTEKKMSIQDQLQELEALAAWFDKDESFDVEEGLQKVKEGAALVKKLKGKIQEVENEFKELEVELSTDD